MGELKINIKPEILLIINLIFVFILFLYLRRNNTQSVEGRHLEEKLLSIQADIDKMSNTQQQIQGQIKTSGEMNQTGQNNINSLVSERLNKVEKSVSESLNMNLLKTGRYLSEIQERLSVIDKAQTNIEKLSGNVLGLQEILSNKQARGAFGEIQLFDIIKKSLPPDSFETQPVLSNNKRADFLIKMPNPPGPIVIDSKFPLEAYNALTKSITDREKKDAEKSFKINVRNHIKDIAEKYIIPGETADGALMFLPSEAIYAELHANFTDLISESFSLKVWVVSPTTCMATLNTVRAILKDARLKEHAERIRIELEHIQKDAQRLEVRATNLNKHFNLASKDLEEIKISSSKISKRSIKFEQIEFDHAKNELGFEKE